tara:strand:+ start:84 stop:497 length:414 start_codon:yes stop_codon:yes gene_type:complete
VNEGMIPPKGRFLQCGSCGNKWFFKKKDIKNFIPAKSIDGISEKNLSKNNNLENEVNTKIEKKEIETDKKEIQIDKKKKINYINFFLVIIISFISLIILLDTFKSQISNFFPSINMILDNLYETIKDIALFFKDLIK